MARQHTVFTAAVAAALLAVGTIASANGLLYVCDTTRLASNNQCIFAASSTNTIGATPHNINRAVAADGFRIVRDINGTQLTVTPKPWSQGDVLAASTTQQTGDALNYVKAFEMVAPLRDKMMYDPASLTGSAAEWAKYTKAFADCSIKTTTEQVTHGSGTVTAYGTADVYALMANPNNQDIHNGVLQYLEEGAIDLVCVMTQLSMDRCTTMRTTLNIPTGGTSTCWQAAYDALYNSAATTTTTAATTATTTTAPATTTTPSTTTSSAAAVSAAAAVVGVLAMLL